jgi:hypothetical protein
MGLRWCHCTDLRRPSRLMNRRRCRMHLRRRGRTRLRCPQRLSYRCRCVFVHRRRPDSLLLYQRPRLRCPQRLSYRCRCVFVHWRRPNGLLRCQRPRLRCPQRLSYRCRRVFVHWRHPNGLLRCHRPRRRLRLAQRRLDSSSTHGSGQPPLDGRATRNWRLLLGNGAGGDRRTQGGLTGMSNDGRPGRTRRVLLLLGSSRDGPT